MDTETLQDDMQGEPTRLSRTNRSVITAGSRNRFEAAAHAVRPLLITRLRRAGASPEDAEDVAQEALLRAWDRDLHFVDDGDLLRWCTVVARRAHIDRIRRQARQLDLGELASDSGARELEAVELRHVLGTVSSAMASLTERERASLKSEPAGARADRASQVRAAVTRHRARHRLRLLVGPFAALGAQFVRVVRRSVPATATSTALAAAALTVTLAVPPDRVGSAVPPGHAFHPGAPAPVAGSNSGPRVPPATMPVSLVRPIGPRASARPVGGGDEPTPRTPTVRPTPQGPDDALLCISYTRLPDICTPHVPQPAAQPAALPSTAPGS